MSRSTFLSFLLPVACAAVLPSPLRAEDELRSPAELASITNITERSAALFTEAAKVLQHPRCMNCHPATRLPTQGDDLHDHVPFMPAGAGDHGAPGIQCATCHTEQNVTTLGSGIASVPGTLHWGLAPAPMAWQGLSVAEICAQLKDPTRNGNRTLEEIHRHVMTDALIAWAWSPGAGRTPAPGSLPQLGALLAAWIDTGAHCPT